MINPFREVNWHPDCAERRAFARSIAIGLPLLALVFGALGWARTHAWPGWTAWVAISGGAAGGILWLVPQFARPFYLAWNGLGCAIGFVMSNLALAAIYFFVVTPMGILLRLAGRDPLQLRLPREGSSYWRDAEKPRDAASYFRQF